MRLVARVDAGSVNAERDLLHRVLANLIDNAIRHSPEESEVRITVEPRDGGVELAVADAGPGIPAEERAAAFDRFVSGRSTTTNRGLGLAFCKVAIEAHGGKIWIEDAAPGAVFRILLPS